MQSYEKIFKINPKIRKDKSGNPKEVYLDIDVYNAIIKDMDALKKQKIWFDQLSI